MKLPLPMTTAAFRKNPSVTADLTLPAVNTSDERAKINSLNANVTLKALGFGP
ncbi:MAG: hypothetical protein IPM82_24525 [Saprospiraceae bacterium]|nr:hypothetical protein [Saprospiraceae bacterium]